MTIERPERRARGVALIGLVFQILAFAFLSLLFVWSGSEAVRALTQMAGVGILIWLTIVLTYHQRVLVQEEAFETEQLRRERQAGLVSGTVFEVEDEALLLARRRLRWMYRWVLPAATLIITGALVFCALFAWNWRLTQPVSGVEWPAIEHADLLIWFLGGAAFLCFLLSRYAIGMARQREWQMLRAGAAYLMGMTLAAVALVAVLAALLMSEKASPILAPEHVLSYVLRYLMLVLAAEFALNLVLDFYRPRSPDEEPRPAFDSRLLGLFTEPGGIARSIAEAINYQFGFEVSSTWFYQLIERSAVPLAGFCVFVLLLASCFVFVGQEECVVVERFGRRMEPDLTPGLHLKLPWPIDRAYRVAVGRVHTLQVGIVSAPQPGQKEDELILWTNQHAQEPHLLVLVATPKLAEYMTAPAAGPETRGATEPATDRLPAARGGGLGESGEAVSVSLLRVSLALEYEIPEAYPWLTGYAAPQEMLEAIAKREIIRYFASVDVTGVLGPQRGPIERALWRTIQKACDDAGLTLKVVYLGLQGVHPPQDAAETFQDVIGAEQKKAASINSAWAEYNKRMSQAAGDRGRAEQLDEAIRKANRLAADPAARDQVEAAHRRRDVLFFGDDGQGTPPVGGEAFGRIARARLERWRLENEAHAQAVAFEQERALQKAAPNVYAMRRYLLAVADAVKGIRKYVIASRGRTSADDSFVLDVRDPMAASLSTALEKKD